MKRALYVTVMILSLVAVASSQKKVAFEFNLRNDNGRQILRILNFWESSLGNGVGLNDPTITLTPIQQAGGFFGVANSLSTVDRSPNGGNQCDRIQCRIVIPSTISLSQTYILSVDVGGVRFWDAVSFESSAVLAESKDVSSKNNELLVKSNTPLMLSKGQTLTVVEKRLEIDTGSYLAKENNNQTQTAEVTSVNDASGSNITEATIKLPNKVRAGTTMVFEVSNLSSSGLFAGQQLTAIGKIERAGDPDPPDAPKTNITISSVASKRKGPIFLGTGTWALRSPKFSSLLGRYSYCGDPNLALDNRNPYDDYSSDVCRPNRSSLSKFLLGTHPSSNDVSDAKDNPPDFFAGIQPQVTFDLGNKASESKNVITLESPFVYYFNVSNREVLTFNPASKSDIALNVYGGWAKTPWYRLADIKVSVGPKVELYKNDDEGAKWWDFKRKSTLFSAKADFEFHRWLGTIAARRKLIKADFVAAGKSAQYARLDGPNFGWKLVPYLVFEVGGDNKEDLVEKTLGGVAQSLTIPKYGIARFKGGIEGRIEWLIKGRLVGFSASYVLMYLAKSEKNSYVTDDQLLLRSLRGYHPYFKTTFEFSLDPAKRLFLSTTWENGVSLPGLEFLNKLSSGVTIKY